MSFGPELITALGVVDPTPPRAQILERLSLSNVIYAAFILALVAVAVKAVDLVLGALGRRVPRARFFFNILLPVIRFGLWLAGFLATLYIFSPTSQTLLAVLASVGIALGLGAQDLIKSLIGGLVILVDRPYQLGDLVQIGDAYGEVISIGLRSTKIQTFGDTMVTVPNSEVLSNLPWNNNGGVPDCQVATDLYVPPGTDPGQLLEVGREVAYSSPYLLLSKPVVCLLEDGWQNGPFLKLVVKGYVYDHRFTPRFQSDVTHRAKAEFLKRGWLAPQS